MIKVYDYEIMTLLNLRMITFVYFRKSIRDIVSVRQRGSTVQRCSIFATLQYYISHGAEFDLLADVLHAGRRHGSDTVSY